MKFKNVYGHCVMCRKPQDFIFNFYSASLNKVYWCCSVCKHSMWLYATKSLIKDFLIKDYEVRIIKQEVKK